jgi:hypothetical protein
LSSILRKGCGYIDPLRTRCNLALRKSLWPYSQEGVGSEIGGHEQSQRLASSGRSASLSTQSLTRDINAGLSVAVEDQCRAGDVVRIANMLDVVQTPVAPHGNQRPSMVELAHAAMTRRHLHENLARREGATG